MLLSNAEYLSLGRQIARLLGASLDGASAEALRELARAYDPEAQEARISAEVYVLHKFLLMQACVGVFPDAHVDHVVGGFVAALNEQIHGMQLSEERMQAMERMWQLRAGQFEQPFANDRASFLDVAHVGSHWRQTIVRFCENIRELASPPDIWSGSAAPSHTASRALTALLDNLIATLGEMNRLYFNGAV